ncbi:MAG TPA: ABC transporter transmembrane domain-containing protein, partial [Planctomycetota bacterium]|nr:ABC transporter transmembrane domain-containing protein [Planctomycetota bacterium]
MQTLLEDSQHAGVRLETWKHLFGFAQAYKPLMGKVALFAFGTGLADISFPLVTKDLVDAITGWREQGSGASPALGGYVWAYLGLTLLLATCVHGFIRSVGRLKTSVSADIRRAGFANLQRLEFAYYDERAAGWLMARMTGDCERLANIMAWGLLDVLWSSTFLVGIASVLLVLNWKLGLLVLTVVPLLAYASRAFQKRILLTSRRIRKIASGITADFNESIMGVLTTKIFSQQGPQAAQFSIRVDELYQSSVRNALLSALYLPAVLTIGSLATAMVLVRGGYAVSLGSMGLGTLVAFLAYTRLMFEPLQQLAHIFSELQMAQASGERIVELLTREPAIQDSESVQSAVQAQKEHPVPGRAEDGGPIEVGAIEFENVSFAYGAGQGGDKQVLSDVQVRIEPGETVALVGSTGGGKTTLISLLCRFYEPTAGRITLGGIDLQARSLHWVQSIFGVVLQDPYLFRGSVRENIRYGQLDASDAEVEAAASLVGAH